MRPDETHARRDALEESNGDWTARCVQRPGVGRATASPSDEREPEGSAFRDDPRSHTGEQIGGEEDDHVESHD